MTEKPKEVIRLALETIQCILAPLEHTDQIEVLEKLDLACAKLVTNANAQVEALQKKVAEWRGHNEQRMVDVEEARRLLGATPNETLPVAVERALSPLLDRNYDPNYHITTDGQARGCKVCLDLSLHPVAMHTP